MIRDVYVTKDVQKKLHTHNLVILFKKSVQKLLAGENAGLDFKKRKPKSENIWSFRINKQYRALCKRHAGVLTVFYIDDHQ